MNSGVMCFWKDIWRGYFLRRSILTFLVRKLRFENDSGKRGNNLIKENLSVFGFYYREMVELQLLQLQCLRLYTTEQQITASKSSYLPSAQTQMISSSVIKLLVEQCTIANSNSPSPNNTMTPYSSTWTDMSLKELFIIYSSSRMVSGLLPP